MLIMMSYADCTQIMAYNGYNDDKDSGSQLAEERHIINYNPLPTYDNLTPLPTPTLISTI